MDERNASLVLGHGLVTASDSLEGLIALAICLDMACGLELMAVPDGKAIRDEDVREKRAGQLGRPRFSWEYLLRSSERVERLRSQSI